MSGKKTMANEVKVMTDKKYQHLKTKNIPTALHSKRVWSGPG